MAPTQQKIIRYFDNLILERGMGVEDAAVLTAQDFVRAARVAGWDAELVETTRVTVLRVVAEHVAQVVLAKLAA